MRTLSLAADETYTCLFKQVNWGNQPLHTELSAVTFAGSSQKDSLKEDNCAYALKDRVSTSKATLIWGRKYLYRKSVSCRDRRESFQGKNNGCT